MTRGRTGIANDGWRVAAPVGSVGFARAENVGLDGFCVADNITSPLSLVLDAAFVLVWRKTVACLLFATALFCHAVTVLRLRLLLPVVLLLKGD